MQDHLSTGATNVPVNCTSDKTDLTNCLCDQHTWPLYLTTGNIRTDICHTPKQHAWILIGRTACPPKGAKNTTEAWHCTVGTVLSPLRNLDITGSGLRWNCADGFRRLCYPLLAAWVWDYPEYVMIAKVSNVSCPMCEILTGGPMGYSTCWVLNKARDHHVHLQLLEGSNIDVLHTVRVHQSFNQFW